MPIYEYECEKCGSNFELMQSISAKPVTTCIKDKCKGKASRQVSASGFILKGGGWYTSDYPSEARKKGWQQESCHASGGAPDSACSAGTGACAQAATPPEPAKTKGKTAAEKNPYSSGKKKAAKKAKAH